MEGRIVKADDIFINSQNLLFYKGVGVHQNIILFAALLGRRSGLQKIVLFLSEALCQNDSCTRLPLTLSAVLIDFL
jgi:hypothetical protein